MKKTHTIILLFLLAACSSNNDVEVNPTAINFTLTHSWQDTQVNSTNFNNFGFVTENGDTVSSIERLRYVISDVILTHNSGVVTSLAEHKLIDVGQNDLTFTTSASVLPGTYSSVSIRFGLSAGYNVENGHPDLTTANFDVPENLGEGYHYMQFDGKYLDSDGNNQNFNYHAIPAVRKNQNPLAPEDTSVQLNLGGMVLTSNSTITLNMDLYEWFSNPNLWDLNQLNTSLMGNYDAQIIMNQNAASVFSLISVEP